MCLGSNYKRYKALCDACMYVCMCLKLGVNYGQTLGVIVFFHKTEWVNMVLRILNLEGQQNCMRFKNPKKIVVFFSDFSHGITHIPMFSRPSKCSKLYTTKISGFKKMYADNSVNFIQIKFCDKLPLLQNYKIKSTILVKYLINTFQIHYLN